MFTPTVSTAQVHGPLRIDYLVSFKGNQYGNRGTLTSRQDGSISYRVGTDTGTVKDGASRSFVNAATLENNGGTNVGVKVDTASGNFSLGSLILSPQSKTAAFEGVAALNPPFDLYFDAAALFQDFGFPESNGTVSVGFDLSTLTFKLWLLENSRGGVGGLLQIGEDTIELELPSESGCAKLKALIEELVDQKLPYAAGRLQEWLQRACLA